MENVVRIASFSIEKQNSALSTKLVQDFVTKNSPSTKQTSSHLELRIVAVILLSKYYHNKLFKANPINSDMSKDTDKLKRAVIAGASKALSLKDKKLTDSEIMREVMHNLHEIIRNID